MSRMMIRFPILAGFQSPRFYDDKLYVANAFYLAGLIESWGRGIEKICNALSAEHLPLPEYTVHPGDIMIKFSAPKDFVAKVTKKVTKKVTDREQEILHLLLENPKHTMPELAERLGVSRKTIATYIRNLKERGVLKRVGAVRNGYWKVVDDEETRSGFFGDPAL